VNRPKVQRNPKQLQFVTSAVNMQGCPQDEIPEIAMIGRSNAGKSTLINGLGRARIAQVSSTPGKTRLLNFYQAPGYRLVDMPGYGFSSRSGDEQSSWQGMIEPYLSKRKNLIGLTVVMDVRRDWSLDEENLIDWLEPRQLPVVIVLTKADKLNRSDLNKRIAQIRVQAAIDEVLATSSLQKKGYDELLDFFYQRWIKPSENSGAPP
jgi:GTP-binding protein